MNASTHTQYYGKIKRNNKNTKFTGGWASNTENPFQVVRQVNFLYISRQQWR